MNGLGIIVLLKALTHLILEDGREALTAFNNKEVLIVHIKRTITHAFGALALLAAVNVHALTSYTDYAAFELAVQNAGFTKEGNFGNEGFETTNGGVDTPWAKAVYPFGALPSVENMGVTWFHHNPANSGFSVGNLGGSVQQGAHAMLIPLFPSTPTTADMSYSFKTGTSTEAAFNLSAFGGWFKGNQAKPIFTLTRPDNSTATMEFGPLTDVWSFFAFVDDGVGGGFTSVKVTEGEVGTGEAARFFTDNVTFVSQQIGKFPAPAVVPLPAALPLFGMALLGLGVFGRRRKRS